MSFRRAQGRSVNRNTYLDNRLTNFTNPHIYHGDLHVERDQTIGGNLTIGKDLRAANFYATGNYFLDNYILVPAGTINVSAAINAPNGWLICDGNVYAKASYLTLFDAIGQTYMYDVSYDQSNYFRVPDLRGRVVVGSGDNGDAGVSNRAFSEKGGAETHTLTATEMPSHTHSGTTASDGSHIHSSNANGGIGSALSPATGLAYSNGLSTVTTADSTDGELNVYATPIALSINGAGAHTHTFTTGSTGGGAAHNNMQPFIALRYLIKY
jgi:microcystin-dependent protein